MKRFFLLYLLLTGAFGAAASHANKIFVKPPFPTWGTYPGGMTNVEIEVTPLGAYAQIDLVFSIGPASNTAPTDSQEAVIFFDLPAGSYIHDSWLWLNPTTIISAELMERRKASEVYTGIVRRRRDPSLLLNLLSQQYQLNIYPVAALYWRKVKITYSTPVLWQNGKANVPLPTELLAAAQTPPSFALKVNSNGLFTHPSFTDRAFVSWMTSQSGNSTQLSVPASGYSGNTGLSLSYELTFSAGSRLSTFPTGANEGIYELITLPPPAAATPPRHISLVIDHQASSVETYSQSEMKRIVTGFLSTSLRPADLFNIFYRNSTGITSLFSTWHAADSASISSISPAFAGIPSASAMSHIELLKATLLSTKSGPADAETIVLNGCAFSISAADANTLTSNLKLALGSFSRKIHYINYSYAAAPGQTRIQPTLSTFNDLLLRIADSSKGQYIFPAAFYYDDYTQSTIFDLNMQEALGKIIADKAYSTAAYQVAFPLAGFTYNEHGISTGDRFTPQAIYTETGRYYGAFNAPDSIVFQYAGQAGVTSVKSAISNVLAGDLNYRKTWNYYNNKTLAAYGNRYKQEIIDSSIRNRVLSDFTAFLALETGDTIKASVGQSVGGYPLTITTTPNSQPVQASTLTAYPNPFRDLLTVESTGIMEEVSVYTLTGSLVLTRKIAANMRQWIWDGRDNNGGSLPAGIYLIRVAGNHSSTVIRVNKIAG